MNIKSERCFTYDLSTFQVWLEFLTLESNYENRFMHIKPFVIFFEQKMVEVDILKSY